MADERAMLPNESSATAERRAAPRQAVTYRLDVVAGESIAGFLLDVSMTGLRARFKQGLDVGATQNLRIEFPRWLELGKGLDVRGRFVWLRAREGGVTEAGFAFDGLSRKSESVLEVLIQRLSEARVEDEAEAV
jgi:hypothetical protein